MELSYYNAVQSLQVVQQSHNTHKAISISKQRAIAFVRDTRLIQDVLKKMIVMFCTLPAELLSSDASKLREERQ